jgi:hypothetical protein
MAADAPTGASMKTTRPIPSGRQQTLAQDLSRLARSAMVSALEQGSRSQTPPLHVEPAPTPTAPRQMAAVQSADAAAQEQLVASYEACLRSYRKVARAQSGATEFDDVGAAMAMFVAVNLQALHGEEVEAIALQPLERQLRDVTRAAANWDAATLAQRQAFFERIAIVSVLVSGSLAGAASHGPAVLADVQRSARDYLQHLLGLNPDRLTLGIDGLVLRDRAVAAAHV